MFQNVFFLPQGLSSCWKYLDRMWYCHCFPLLVWRTPLLLSGPHILIVLMHVGGIVVKVWFHFFMRYPPVQIHCISPTLWRNAWRLHARYPLQIVSEQIYTRAREPIKEDHNRLSTSLLSLVWHWEVSLNTLKKRFPPVLRHLTPHLFSHQSKRRKLAAANPRWEFRVPDRTDWREVCRAWARWTRHQRKYL